MKEAIKFGLYWLLRNKFTVFTDHKPLQNLNNIRSRTNEELGNLINYLLPFNFKIRCRPGEDPMETIQNEDTDLI